MVIFGETYTLTFGDRGENHAGMQMIGSAASSGFSIDDLKAAEKHYKEKGRKTLFINLNLLAPDTKTEPAYLLIVRDAFGEKEATKIYKEQRNLEKDTKAFMRGRVVNKKARYNLCFDSEAQEPDYENKKGRIVAFDDVPKLKEVKKSLALAFGKKAKSLIAEGNYYYDTEKCYIGFHGDSERKIVIGIRLGDSFPLHYRWYERSEPIGERLEIDLHNGDLYAMSEKAVGTDWKRSSITTLRHAAGYPSSLGLKVQSLVFEENLKTIDPAFSLKRPEYILDSQGYVVVTSFDPFLDSKDIFDSLYQAEELLIKRAIWNIYLQHLKTEDERSLLELELHFSKDKKTFIDKMTDVYSPEEILRYWYLHFSPKDATEEKITLLTTKYSSDIPKLWKNLYYKYVIEKE